MCHSQLWRQVTWLFWAICYHRYSGIDRSLSGSSEWERFSGFNSTTDYIDTVNVLLCVNIVCLEDYVDLQQRFSFVCIFLISG